MSSVAKTSTDLEPYIIPVLSPPTHTVETSLARQGGFSPPHSPETNVWRLPLPSLGPKWGEPWHPLICWGSPHIPPSHLSSSPPLTWSYP